MFPARSTVPSVALAPGLLAAAALALSGCPAKGPPAGSAGPDAGAPSADGGSASAEGVPPPLQLEVRYQVPDAGLSRIDFTPGAARPSIDPTSRLEVSTNIGLQNYRIRLFDEAERAMPSDDQMEELGDKVLYRIQLPAPLKAGHKYALVVDAQTGSAIADSAGRLYPDQRLEFTVAGAREPDSPARPGGRTRPGRDKKKTSRKR